MRLEGKLALECEKDTFWAALFDGEVWLSASEQLERFELVEENQYELAVQVELGPIKGVQTIKLSYSELVPNQSCSFVLEHNLIKEAKGAFDLKLPPEIETIEGQDEAFSMPEDTKSVVVYGMDLDAGNPVFNAAIETLKSKLRENFEEFLTALAGAGVRSQGSRVS
jgi:carbon monoxide dehydrogenase subunit G